MGPSGGGRGAFGLLPSPFGSVCSSSGVTGGRLRSSQFVGNGSEGWGCFLLGDGCWASGCGCCPSGCWFAFAVECHVSFLADPNRKLGSLDLLSKAASEMLLGQIGRPGEVGVVQGGHVTVVGGN